MTAIEKYIYRRDPSSAQRLGRKSRDKTSAQTEGKELPTLTEVNGDVSGYRERLFKFVEAQSVELSFSERIAPAKGLSYGGKITLLSGMQPAEEFSTLAHEIAHEMLHRGDRRTLTTKQVRETEAEAVAFVVCQAIGLADRNRIRRLHPALAWRRRSSARELGSRPTNRCCDSRGHCPRASGGCRLTQHTPNSRTTALVPYTLSVCGRYRLARKKEILAEVFDVGDDDNWSPRYNIAPSQSVPVVRQDTTRPVRSISLIRRGLIPFWAKDAKAGYKMINARAETIAEKLAFREPLLSRRCLILADGFYEWAKFSKGKSPFCFTLTDDSVFAFAGIWDRWKNSERELVETCSIITTSANALVSDIHDRMPVILKCEDYDRWLDPGFKQVDDILDLLKPYQADSMRRYRVSTRINSAKNDDPACADEHAPELLF